MNLFRGRPRTSAALQPYMRSASGFHSNILNSISVEISASEMLSISPARYRLRSSPCSRDDLPALIFFAFVLVLLTFKAVFDFAFIFSFPWKDNRKMPDLQVDD